MGADQHRKVTGFSGNEIFCLRETLESRIEQFRTHSAIYADRERLEAELGGRVEEEKK